MQALCPSCLPRSGLSPLVTTHCQIRGFRGGSDGKDSPCNAGDLGSIARGEGTASRSGILAWRAPLDRGASWATVHGVAELDTTEALSTAQPPGQSPRSEGVCCSPKYIQGCSLSLEFLGFFSFFHFPAPTDSPPSLFPASWNSSLSALG